MTQQTTAEAANGKAALVLGATGGIGGAVAQALMARGWAVRGLARDIARAQAGWPVGRGTIQWHQGDAMVQADVVAAAQGVQAIVHAVNPPGYRDWDKLVLPMIDNTIAAACAAGGARILLPGTVYNFDAATTPVICADSPQLTRSVKGRLRVEMERRLQAASETAPALIVRAGDFFGADARQSWFSQAMVTPGKPVRRIITIADKTGHDWAYLPDLAQAMAQLLDHPGLRPFDPMGFEGFWDPDGRRMPALIAQTLGRDHLPAWRFPWGLMRMIAPFGGFPREIVDTMEVWHHPMRIDNTRLTDLLGEEPRTPPLQAMRETLAGLGCLPSSSA